LNIYFAGERKCVCEREREREREKKRERERIGYREVIEDYGLRHGETGSEFRVGHMLILFDPT